MITKKQKRSSRKNMAQRSAKRYFNKMQSTILSTKGIAMPVMPKATGASSAKRASGRGN